MNKQSNPLQSKTNTGATWSKPELTLGGTISDLVRQGGGKLSASGGDPGEGKKQSGNDPA